MSDTSQLRIASYEMRPVACHAHDPRASSVAIQVASLISSRLPQIRVEHVGSTAVPGCAGKGIIDLMIAVPEGAMPSVKEALDALGFQPQPHDSPFPEDRPMKVGSVTCDDMIFLLHIHLIPADSPEVEQMRFFRACLRSDPELLKAYVAFKKKIIAKGATDPQTYAAEKDKFIQMLLQ